MLILKCNIPLDPFTLNEKKALYPGGIFSCLLVYFRRTTGEYILYKGLGFVLYVGYGEGKIEEEI